MFLKRSRLLCLSLALVFAAVVLSGCPPKTRKPEGILDTPEHHTIIGNRLLEKGNFQEAKREFGLALSLDHKYSGAHVGMGVAMAHLGEFDKAYDHLKLGKRYAKTDQETIWARVGYIRYYTIQGEKGFVDDAYDHFVKAKVTDENAPAPYYYMGECYFKGLEFDEAAGMFTKVLSINTHYVKQADERLALVRKIQRAQPGTAIGKKLAIEPAITRADVAALFIQELKLEKLFTRFARKEYDTSYKAPVLKPATEYTVKTPKVKDVGDHPLRNDIHAVSNIGLRGLEPYPDHTFRPNENIIRAEYAMMLEDIFIKITGDDEVATRYIGMGKELAPDVSETAPYFNAVMFCIQRGLLPVMDQMHGAFMPLEPVSGADALLAIRNFKEMLKL